MLNKLVLGTVQMGIPYGINNKDGQISLSEAFNILEFAYQNGINTLDTAEGYGDAHCVIGEFHKRNSTINFNVITKIPPFTQTENLQNKVEGYLEDLCITRINVLMLHSYDTYKHNPGIIEELVHLKQLGLVKHIGISVYSNKQIEDLIGDQSVEVIQLPFNLLDNYSIRGEILKQAKNQNKIIHTRSVFLQGLFFMNRNNDNPVLQKLNSELKRIDEIASDHKLKIKDLALKYCLQQDIIDQVLMGVDSLKQINENLISLEKPLNTDILDSINNIIIKDPDLLNPSLW